jgi:K+-transporting ATPase ATPase A chain
MAALIRGLARRRGRTLGNFWVDLTRTVVRIMLPLSFVVAIVLVSQGVIQNFDGFTVAATLEGAAQQIPGGPVASQVAIKQLGTNGGGFFNVNSAHPFENSTTINNFVETWSHHPTVVSRSTLVVDWPLGVGSGAEVSVR